MNSRRRLVALFPVMVVLFGLASSCASEPDANPGEQAQIELPGSYPDVELTVSCENEVDATVHVTFGVVNEVHLVDSDDREIDLNYGATKESGGAKLGVVTSPSGGKCTTTLLTDGAETPIVQRTSGSKLALSVMIDVSSGLSDSKEGASGGRQVNSRYALYESTLDSAGIQFRSGEDGTFESDENICERISSGRMTEFQLAKNERTGYPGDSNGDRVRAMIPVLCPENADFLERATNGDVRMEHFSDGKYLVVRGLGESGVRTVQPGKYQTEKTVSDCYWERSDDQGRIVDNAFISIAPQVTVTIATSDSGFTSEGCGTWNRVD